MIRVQVRYCAQARAAAGRAGEDLELPEGCTLAQLLVKLAADRGPSLRKLLLDAAGHPQPALLIFIKGEQIPTGKPHILQNGDCVEILTPISGG